MKLLVLIAVAPLAVLPAPRFGPPAQEPAPGPVRFELVSSKPAEPGRQLPSLRPPGLRIEGPDGLTQHLVVAPGRYALDRRDGHVLARILLPSAPELIVRHGNRLTVDTYDHRVTVRLVGAS